MNYMKYKLINESIKFIELCQMHVLKNGMTIDLYNVMTDIKIRFLKDMVKTEESDILLRDKFFNKVDNILKINSLIYSNYYSKKANV